MLTIKGFLSMKLKRKRFWRDLAYRKAKQSISNYKISAIAISKNGNVLATGINRPRYGCVRGIHAEEEVLKKAGANNIAVIILCRINRYGEVLPIDPCEKCQKILNKYGIKVKTVEL